MDNARDYQRVSSVAAVSRWPCQVSTRGTEGTEGTEGRQLGSELGDRELGSRHAGPSVSRRLGRTKYCGALLIAEEQASCDLPTLTPPTPAIAPSAPSFAGDPCGAFRVAGFEGASGIRGGVGTAVTSRLIACEGCDGGRGRSIEVLYPSVCTKYSTVCTVCAGSGATRTQGRMASVDGNKGPAGETNHANAVISIKLLR